MTMAHSLMFFLLAGFLILGVGFTLREREWGVRIMIVGIIATLTPIGYYIFTAVQYHH